MLSNPAFVALFAVLAVGQGPEDREAGPPEAKKPAPKTPAGKPLVLSPTIRKAISAYDELDYRKSQQFLRKALERSLQDRQRAVALAYLGRIRAIRGGHDKAIRTFMRVLALDETYEITWQESPRIQDAWRAATARHETQKQQSSGTGETAAESAGGEVREEAPENSELELPPLLVDAETESPANSAPEAEPPRDNEPAPELDLTEIPPASRSNRWKYWVGGAAVVVAAAVVTVLVITLPDEGPNRRGAIPWQLP